LRLEAVESLFVLAEKPTMPEVLVQVQTGREDSNPQRTIRIVSHIVYVQAFVHTVLSRYTLLAQCLAWILGEYSYLAETIAKEEVLDKLCNLMHAHSSSRGFLVTAMMKLVAQVCVFLVGIWFVLVILAAYRIVC
jgi:hypothetical protein